MKPWLYGVLALAIIAALGGIANAIYSAGRNAKQLEWDEASRERRTLEERAGSAASRRFESDRARERVVYRTITQTVDRVVDRPVYRNVCMDADGLCIANAAIRGESADSCKPDAAVREPAPAK